MGVDTIIRRCWTLAAIKVKHSEMLSTASDSNHGMGRSWLNLGPVRCADKALIGRSRPVVTTCASSPMALGPATGQADASIPTVCKTKGRLVAVCRLIDEQAVLAWLAAGGCQGSVAGGRCGIESSNAVVLLGR